MIRNKLKDIQKRTAMSEPVVITKINDPYQMSAGYLLEIECQTRLPDGRRLNIDVDISFNKILEILNSQLIATYCMHDSRFHRVAMVLKTWNRGLDKNKSKRLNSFSIYLLLLAFMLHHQYIVNLQAEAAVTEMIEAEVYSDSETRTKITTEMQFLTDLDQIEIVSEERKQAG